MPDAARKWLESYDADSNMDTKEDIVLEEPAAHLRRLLAENERLEAEVRSKDLRNDSYIDEVIEKFNQITQLEADKSALVAYVRAVDSMMGKKFGLKWYTSKEYWSLEPAWQALSEELKELIDE